MRFVIGFKIAVVISALVFINTVTVATPWVMVAPLNQPRSRLAAVALNGELYAIGGSAVSGVIFNTVEKFNPNIGIWENVAPLNYSRTYAAAAAASGYIYVFGGRIDSATPEPHVERYDPQENEWTVAAEMTDSTALPREGLQAITVDELIWVIGGYSTTNGYHGNVDVFDPVTESFIDPVISIDPRVGHAAAAQGGNIRIVGGVHFDVLREHLAYMEPLWIEEEAMLEARMDLGAAIAGDSLFAIGGSDGDEPLNSVECFRFSTGSWSAADSMNHYRENHGVVELNGDIYAIGGYGGAGSGRNYLDSVEKLPLSGCIGVKDFVSLSPDKINLNCFPNPFNSQLSIEFDPAGHSLTDSRLSIFNSLGQQVWSLGLGDAGTGVKPVIWRGTDNYGNQLSSGLYYVQIGGNINQAIKPIVLLR